MQPAQKLKILESLETKADLVALEEKLNALSYVYGKVAANYEQAVKQNLDFITFSKISEDFKILGLNLNIQADFESYLDLIEQNTINIKILKLTMAQAPTKATIDEIFYWIHNSLGDNILLDAHIDSSIIGGLIIEYGGKYKDYSLKSKLNSFLKTNTKLL